MADSRGVPTGAEGEGRRATVWRCTYRADAFTRLERIPEHLDPKVAGSPGNWIVTRLLESGESKKEVYRGAVA